jgi:hypothetical protein
MPVILALIRRLRQEAYEFEASLDYRVSPFLKKKGKKERKKPYIWSITGTQFCGFLFFHHILWGTAPSQS